MTDASQPWDGVPLSPEQDGWHWLRHPEDLRPFPARWSAAHHAWADGAMYTPRGIVELGLHYIAPCPAPDEIAAREQAAAAEMRERCAAACASLGRRWELAGHDAISAGLASSAAACADIVRALPLPAPSLDAMLEPGWLQRDIERAQKRRAGWLADAVQRAFDAKSREIGYVGD